MTRPAARGTGRYTYPAQRLVVRYSPECRLLLRPESCHAKHHGFYGEPPAFPGMGDSHSGR